MPASVMARQGLVLGGAAAAAWLSSGNSLALADGKKDKDAAAPYFDPEALERGAKALREINSSPHAKQASQHWSKYSAAAIGKAWLSIDGCVRMTAYSITTPVALVGY